MQRWDGVHGDNLNRNFNNENFSNKGNVEANKNGNKIGNNSVIANQSNVNKSNNGQTNNFNMSNKANGVVNKSARQIENWRERECHNEDVGTGSWEEEINNSESHHICTIHISDHSELIDDVLQEPDSKIIEETRWASPKIKFNIYQRSIEALIDCGAEVTCISQQFY